MAIASPAVSQAAFYREWLMSRQAFNPRDFGVDMDRDEFMDLMVEEFNTVYRGMWTIDELCLHPRDAMRFCDDIRHKHRWPDVADDIVLRAVMIRRKNP